MHTLLIVDDSEDSAELLAKVLRRYGYETVTAAHGRDGLDVLNQTKIDLILLDLMMPVMDGVQFLRALRGESSSTAPPVILLTALSEHPMVDEAMSLGAERCFRKAGFRIAELRDCIASRLQPQA